MDTPTRRAAKAAPDIVFSADDEGRVVHVSRDVADVLGYEPEELAGEPCRVLLCTEDVEETEAAWERLASGEAVCGLECRVRHRDGHAVVLRTDAKPRLDAAGRFLGVDAVARPVLGPRPALGSAMDYAGLLELLDQLPCVVYIARVVWPPRIDFVSRSVEQYTGHKPREIIADASLLFRRVHPDDRERVMRRAREDMGRAEPSTTELRLVHRNGRDVFHVAARSSPVVDAEGRVVSRYGMLLDVTAQKGLEQELRQSQRLAAIGEMAAMMAHEIRNPLAGMSLCLRVLREGENDPRVVRECYDDLAEGLRRINTTVARALDFAKARPPALRRCSLVEIVEAARSLTAAYVRKGQVAFELDLPPDLPELVADPAQLEQLFVNLILNACKAMPGGGRLDVRARAEGRRLHADVADTGIGIEPGLHGQIFSPFYSGFGDGTGLGLSLCQRIVDAHGGAIRVESAAGRGSTFHIELPLEPPNAPSPHH